MSQGPGGPPGYGPPQFAPQPGQPGPSGPPPAGDGPSGLARMLALGAAGVGLVIYVLGFLSTGGSLAGMNLLLLGGGLLTGASVLPRAGRVLLPGAIAVTTGALTLLQLVADGGAPGVVIVGLVLAVVEAAAAVGAYLVDAGLVNAPARAPAHGPRQGQPYQPNQPGYPPPPGFGGPPGFGPPPGPGPAVPGGPLFGAPPVPGPSGPGGWGAGPTPPLLAKGPGESPSDPAERSTPRDDISSTTAIPVVTGAQPPADRAPRPAEDGTAVFGETAVTRRAQDPPAEDGAAMFGETTVTRRNQDRPAEDAPSPFGESRHGQDRSAENGPTSFGESRHGQDRPADNGSVPFGETRHGQDRPAEDAPSPFGETRRSKDRAGADPFSQDGAFGGGSSFGQGGVFDESATKSRHGQDGPGDDRAASTGAVPMPPAGSTARPPSRPADETGVFQEGGMFGEPGGEGRHEQPADDRPARNGVPPADQTWFMPPGDRPSN